MWPFKKKKQQPERQTRFSSLPAHVREEDIEPRQPEEEDLAACYTCGTVFLARHVYRLVEHQGIYHASKWRVYCDDHKPPFFRVSYDRHDVRIRYWKPQEMWREVTHDGEDYAEHEERKRQREEDRAAILAEYGPNA